jgi:phenylpropionate dioxygenase-like ring-hydroxylating dioxygenase large terminal subunit
MREHTPSDTTGRAYDHPRATYDAGLAEVGRGTPGGELLRRYWQPVALASEATDLPRQIRILGEDLILFRDKSGTPGLLYPRCMHRGASLRYGRVEQDGIRCCYHGWKYDAQGRCLDQAAEPDGGRHRHVIRQPWYPVQEFGGAIFAYMGPASQQPVFPRFSVFENLAPREELVAAYGSPEGESLPFPIDYNFFQMFENALDLFHIPILHNLISGPQFGAATGYRRLPQQLDAGWSLAECGVAALLFSPGPNGMVNVARAEVVIPNIVALPDFFGQPGPGTMLNWHVPLDDARHVMLTIARRKKQVAGSAPGARGFMTFGPEKKLWRELTGEEHQRYPGDYEAQSGQGTITLHSEEHLASTDRGIAMLRRMYRQQCKTVEGGGNPVGVAFAEADALIRVRSGLFMAQSREHALGTSSGARASVAAT